MYAVQSFMLYINRRLYTFKEFIGVSMFISVMSYLAAGLFNDQIVSVAPLFYVMAGLGFAVNYMVRHEQPIDTLLKEENANEAI